MHYGWTEDLKILISLDGTEDLKILISLDGTEDLKILNALWMDRRSKDINCT